MIDKKCWFYFRRKYGKGAELKAPMKSVAGGVRLKWLCLKS
jgi:hypothetical protein